MRATTFLNRRIPLLSLSLLLLSMPVLSARLAASPMQRKSSTLTRAERQRLNLFFSNCAEAHVRPFRRGAVSDSILIEFGVYHNFLNDYKRFHAAPKPMTGRIAIPAHFVQEAAQKYFGRSIKQHQSTGNILYRSGYYAIQDAVGDPTPFAYVSRLRSLGKLRYVAYLNVYQVAEVWDGDIHAAPATWKATKDSDKPTLEARMRATVEKVGASANSRYILLDYKSLWSRTEAKGHE